MPVPRIFGLYDRTMWNSINAGEMRLQRCACGHFRYPPGPLCPKCLSDNFSWEPISGEGKILSWTVFHRQYLPSYPVPTTVVAVQLAEGPIIISNIDSLERHKLALDVPVSIFYGDHPDGYKLPRFYIAFREDHHGYT